MNPLGWLLAADIASIWWRTWSPLNKARGEESNLSLALSSIKIFEGRRLPMGVQFPLQPGTYMARASNFLSIFLFVNVRATYTHCADQVDQAQSIIKYGWSQIIIFFPLKRDFIKKKFLIKVFKNLRLFLGVIVILYFHDWVFHYDIFQINLSFWST